MSAYDVIMKKDGLGDFQRLISRWNNLSGNIDSLPKGAPVILPDIFLVSKTGSGRTLLLKLLADFIEERENLLDFYGDARYFEFYLNYCPPSAPFEEIVRFMDEVKGAAGFRNEYRGIIFIDVDEWRGHCEEKHFRNFLEYLADNSDDWLIVFSVTDGDDADEIEQLRSIVSSFLRIEKVTIEPPTRKMLMQYMDERLSLCGLSLTDEARVILAESIELLERTKYFDGFKTVKMLSYDVAYSVYSDSGDVSGVIGADAVSRFKKDGEYIRVMCHKLGKPVIGF